MRKLSSALALFMVSQAIGLSGYVPPVQEVVNGATRLIEQAQPQAFITVIRLIFALLPTLLVGGAALFALRYPLSAAMHTRLNALLVSRRAGEAESPEMRLEAAALRRELVG